MLKYYLGLVIRHRPNVSGRWGATRRMGFNHRSSVNVICQFLLVDWVGKGNPAALQKCEKLPSKQIDPTVQSN